MRCSSTLLLAAIIGLAALPAAAQPAGQSVRITRETVVLEAPRGDSVPVGKVAIGDRVSVLDRQSRWLLISREGEPQQKESWHRGWIHESALSAADARAVQPAARRRGEMMWRALGQGAGLRFAAKESFATIFDSSFGGIYGGGGQVVWPGGAFAQVTFERYRAEGTRALVSGSQIFATTTPTRVTVTPVLVSAGVRYASARRYAPYVGAGVGWHSLQEHSPVAATPEIKTSKLGYHTFGGVELPVWSWLSFAGEAQWSTVPDGLGGTGIPALFAEDDLGGVALRFKVIVGK